MIVPIVMLAIKDSAADMSPYVRKTAAHAIPKLYRLVIIVYLLKLWTIYYKR
jgi:vesicle coat complex subunit